jgi:hypothetical protein
MKRIVLIISLVLLVLLVCGVGWGGGSFVVLGKSEQGEDVQRPSLELAIQDGLAKAVEEAVRSKVAPQTMKKRQEALSKEFYQKAESFVLSYKLLEKIALPTGYQALLEVVVDTQGISGRLTALGFLKGRGEFSTLHTAQLIVSGIRTYQIYLQIEQLLKEDSEVQDFSLSEIEPTKFTWKVIMRGEIGGFANRFSYHDFGGLKAKVVDLHAERLEIVLSR